MTRWAAVPVMTVLIALGTVVAAAPAEALGTCYSPLPMANVAAGAVTSNGEDYWRYNASGTTTINLNSVGAYMYVYTTGACWSPACNYWTTSCTVTYNGPIVIQVMSYNDTAAYVLTATSTAPPTGPCNRLNTTGVCVDLTTGTTVASQPVYNVTTVPAATHTVGGWLDAYRFPLQTGGSVVAPCVVLKVNATNANPCVTAGATFVSRTATLVNQTATQPEPAFGTPLATVRVCNATLTATVAGYGVEQIPIYSTC